MANISEKFLSLLLVSLFFLGLPVFLFQRPSKVIYYYVKDCPSCQRVNAFLSAYRIEEKFSFAKKEVSFNKRNQNELGLRAKKCGLQSKEIPVPFVWDGQNCIIGDRAVIEFFKEKAGL